jgi:DNA-binding transcriptional LysR family regulator
MNLDYLHTLVSVVEHGNLSAAARAKRISQPAVTKQVQRMESELGLALLVRGPKRQVELTPAGAQVLDFARETLARYEELERQLAELKEVGKGALVLAASTIPGEYVLPQLIAGFRRQYPQVEVQMTISDTAEVATQVLDGEADLGVIGSAVRRPGLRLKRLVGDEVVLALPAQHPLAGREKVAVDELRGHPLILREKGSGTRRSVETALLDAGHVLPEDNVVFTLGSTQSILQAVAQGLGMGFVSARAAAQAQASGQVTWVRLKDVDLERDLFLIYLPERIGEPLVARFLQYAPSHVEESG